MQRSIVTTTLALYALGACAPAATVRPPTTAAIPAVAAPRGAETITATDMYARIAFLASDALRGRDTPSQGLDAAAAYLVSEYRRVGLEPAGEAGTFYQRWPYPLRRQAAGVRFHVKGGRGERVLRYGRDFYMTGGTVEPVSGPSIVVQPGSAADTAQALAGLRGKVAVFRLTGPNNQNREFRLERNRLASLAERNGAVAAVHVLMNPTWTEDSIGRYADLWARPGRQLGGTPTRFPVVMLRLASFEQAFGAGLATITLSAPEETLDRATAPNVVAVLRGSDPLLRNEYVVLSAHMDHVGVGAPVNGDSIYNGADDDASGTAALVEIAEAMASLPVRPRRSVIFLHVSGEEKGLLGSRWYSDHPTVPLQQIVANVNIDMIGRNSPDTVVVIGKDYSTLGAVVNSVGGRHPELRLTAADDIWPEERFFFRSDHFNFARKEIPAIFFFTGVHEDYHRPSDTVDKIDSDKAMRVTRLIYHTAMEIANADSRPTWDPRGLEEVRRLTR